MIVRVEHPEDSMDPVLFVDYGGNVVEYREDELGQLDLAYASTVHKSQGSEYETVIMCMMECHRNMLLRKLVYTGLTRAKKNFIFIGEASALCKAIKNTTEAKRYTLLEERLAS